MDLQSGKMARIALKGHLDLALERLPQPRLNSILFKLRQDRSGRDGHLLSAFGLVDESAEGIGDIRKKSNTVVFHQQPEERLSNRRTADSSCEFRQDTDLFLYHESRRSDDMMQRR